MMRRLKERLKKETRPLSEVSLSDFETKTLSREDLEARKERIDQENLEFTNKNPMNDRFNPPGIVSGMGSIVSRTAGELRSSDNG